MTGSPRKADVAMTDATHLKAQRTTSSMELKEKQRGRMVGRTEGGLNSKLHAVADTMVRPVRLLLSPAMSATTLARGHFLRLCLLPNGCSRIAVVMPTGSERD